MSLFNLTQKWLKSPMKDQRGIALILSVSSLGLLVYIAMQVMYDASVEYTVNGQALNRLKAYYAAQSGIDISLLRIKLYQKIKQKLGNKAQGMTFLEEIWKFPMIWPLKLPESASSINKEETKEKVAESFLDSTFTTKIEDEGSKIDINDLVSPSDTLRNLTRNMLLQIFESRVRTDEEFRRKYANYRFSDLLGFIADWMSPKRTSFVNGDKARYYSDIPNQTLPPNRAFRTLAEVKLVAGMVPELYEMLEPRITIYGLKGINPNNASTEVLMSLDPGITKEVADMIQGRVRDPLLGPFQNPKDFWDFVQSRTPARLLGDPSKVPIVTDRMVSFRISSLGNFGNSKREITAITFDLNTSAKAAAEYIKNDQNQGGQQTSQTPTTTPPGGPAGQPGQSPTPAPAQVSLPKGPPRIVYWSEQ